MCFLFLGLCAHSPKHLEDIGNGYFKSGTTLSNQIRVLKSKWPQARNALSKNLVGLMEDALAKVRFDKDVRVLVLRSAAPGMFCAGADLKERAQMPLEEVNFIIV